MKLEAAPWQRKASLAAGMTAGTAIALVGLAIALALLRAIQLIGSSPVGNIGNVTTALGYLVAIGFVTLVAGLAIAANAVTFLGRKAPTVRLAVYAYSGLALLTGLLLLIAVNVMTLPSDGNITTSCIMIMVAGAAGLAAAVLWGRSPQMTLAAAVTGAGGAVLLFVAQLVAGSNSSGPTVGATFIGLSGTLGALAGNSVGGTLSGLAFVAAGIAAVVAVVARGPARITYVLLLVAAAVLQAVSFLLAGLDGVWVLRDWSFAQHDGMIATALILAYIAAWLSLLACVALLAAGTFAFMANRDGLRAFAGTTQGGPGAEQSIGRSTRRLACPQCQAIVTVGPLDSPVCQSCGFSA